MSDDERIISPGFSDRIRDMGGSKDLVEYTRSLEARFSQRDLDRAFNAGFLGALVIVGFVCAVVVLVTSQ